MNYKIPCIRSTYSAFAHKTNNHEWVEHGLSLELQNGEHTAQDVVCWGGAHIF